MPFAEEKVRLRTRPCLLYSLDSKACVQFGSCSLSASLYVEEQTVNNQPALLIAGLELQIGPPHCCLGRQSLEDTS
jgi:hypothetical protein